MLRRLSTTQDVPLPPKAVQNYCAILVPSIFPILAGNNDGFNIHEREMSVDCVPTIDYVYIGSVCRSTCASMAVEGRELRT